MTRNEPVRIVRTISNRIEICRASRRAGITFDAFGNGQKDTGNESLAVMRLLEDGNLLSKTGT